MGVGYGGLEFCEASEVKLQAHLSTLTMPLFLPLSDGPIGQGLHKTTWGNGKEKILREVPYLLLGVLGRSEKKKTTQLPSQVP